ncbi:ceramidase domain-containing protein [Pseudovibrio brasiliensis]|uniref:Ceramidase domain-containing protein n=1 Tax=Pseudovibrio brasiliensis TaxID=1898042 RepID=A0ABX8AXA3_9HYPH|nr:ceramidase domain-containing protein [Pseudovibrio brasiliensis]QUS58525.1 ceramidase domain-containing protein [Pseudovibrio brasiliensis]
MLPADYIDLYCERTAPGFWNEPLNALSNLSFIVAALVALYLVRRRGNADLAELVLITLAAAIGVGSFLFHTFANTWSELADVIPIWSFVAFYIITVIYRATGENLFRTLRASAIAVGLTAVIFWFSSSAVVTGLEAGPDPLNGSMQYLPAVVALLVATVLMQLRKHPARTYITFAAATFVISLAFRTIDIALCFSISFGTHFMWHLLNGLMIGLLLAALVLKMKPKGAS